MEIVWVDRRDGSDRFYLALPQHLSREQFFTRAKVTPDSYAGRLIERLYRSIFERSLELKRDYGLYYQMEYDTFYRYLRRRLLLLKSEAEIVADCFENSVIIIEYKPTYYFLRDDTGQGLLRKLLAEEEAE
jgi:hypothetical protein